MSKQYTTEDFIIRAHNVHGDKYDYSKSVYIKAIIKLSIHCTTCDTVFTQTPASHLSGRGCPTCKIHNIKTKQRKTTHQFILDAYNIHGKLYDYSKVKYVNAKTKVNIICSKHGNFNQKPNNHLNGKGCPICKSSKGELFISKWLSDHNMIQLREYKFSDCIHIQPLPFDFYLPDINICIEYDGELHYKPYTQTINGDIKFKECQFRDSLKTVYCFNNNIKLIRIPYWEFNNIDDILKKELM